MFNRRDVDVLRNDERNYIYSNKIHIAYIASLHHVHCIYTASIAYDIHNTSMAHPTSGEERAHNMCSAQQRVHFPGNYSILNLSFLLYILKFGLSPENPS